MNLEKQYLDNVFVIHGLLSLAKIQKDEPMIKLYSDKLEVALKKLEAIRADNAPESLGLTCKDAMERIKNSPHLSMYRLTPDSHGIFQMEQGKLTYRGIEDWESADGLIMLSTDDWKATDWKIGASVD